MCERIFHLLEREGDNYKGELSQGCFKLLTVLLRECALEPLSEPQLRLLVHFITGAIETSDMQNTAFTLLKLVIKNKMVVAEIYDLMKTVGDKMIRNDSSSLRQQCQHAFFQFMVYYPMGDTRLRQHLHFLVNNLGYPHESGRKSVLELLTTIFSKFPPAVLERHAEFFFV